MASLIRHVAPFGVQHQPEATRSRVDGSSDPRAHHQRADREETVGRSSVMLTRCEMGRKRDAGSRGSCVGVACFLVERITFTHTLVLLVHLRGKRPRHGAGAIGPHSEGEMREPRRGRASVSLSGGVGGEVEEHKTRQRRRAGLGGAPSAASETSQGPPGPARAGRPSSTVGLGSRVRRCHATLNIVRSAQHLYAECARHPHRGADRGGGRLFSIDLL